MNEGETMGTATLEQVPIGKLKPDPANPRTDVDAGELAELAASIKSIGILEPLIARPNGAGYVLVAGSRRLAAARKAGLKTVPVVVRSDLDDDARRAEAMLIENLQRSDLAPLEEAAAFQRWLELSGSTQRDLATKIGVSQSHVSKRLALLELPDVVTKALDRGEPLLVLRAGGGPALSVRIEEEVIACHTSDAFLWSHGWVDPRKFKGALLSRASARTLDCEADPDAIVKAKVCHGWVITVVGDTSGCGWDSTIYFVTQEPEVVDGRWDGATEYVESDDPETWDEPQEQPAEVIDGPHKATWIGVG